MNTSKLETFYTVKAGKYTYYMVITVTRDYNTNEIITYGLDFGGKLKGCVNIVVENINYIPSLYKELYTEQQKQAYQNNKKIAYISWIGYHQECSLGQDLAKGQGTRHMVRTAMTQVMKRYRWVNAFKLEDASQVECKAGFVVSLFENSILVNNKSYYEKYFGAVLLDELSRDQYNKRLSAMVSVDAKQSLTFPYFIEACKLSNVSIASVIKPIYEYSNSYLGFFKNVQSYCKENNLLFCEFIYPWALEFVNQYILKNGRYASDKWLIDGKNVALINAEEWNTEVQQISKINAEREDLRKLLPRQSGGHFLGLYADLEL